MSKSNVDETIGYIMDRHYGAWWWLSFADDSRPKGQQFLGVAVVRAPSFVEAVKRAHELGINPGGQCAGQEIPAFAPPPPELLDHLVVDQVRIAELDRQWGAAVMEAIAPARSS